MDLPSANRGCSWSAEPPAVAPGPRVRQSAIRQALRGSASRLHLNRARVSNGLDLTGGPTLRPRRRPFSEIAPSHGTGHVHSTGAHARADASATAAEYGERQQRDD